MLFSKVGQFWLRLPWAKEKVLVSRQTSEFQTDGNYKYHGKISVDGVEVGYLSVLLEGDKQFGRLIIDERAYRLDPLGRKAMALLEEYPDDAPGSGCGNSVSPKPQASLGGGTKNNLHGSQVRPRVSETAASSFSAAPVVRVLVMFTDRADAIWDPVVSAQASMAELNQALLNSDINQAQLRFELAGVERLPGFVENAITPDNDVLRFRTDPLARTRRVAQEADIAILLTDGNYLGGTRFGQVARTAPGDSALAYGIVEIDAPGERQTFPHEVAHLLGGQHDDTTIDPINFPNVSNYAHGYQWRPLYNPVWWTPRRSILHTTGTRRRELRFSNPDLRDGGVRTGTDNVFNVARQLRDRAGMVACYVDVPQLSASVSGPSQIEPWGAGSFSAVVANCGAALAYRWELSEDGANYFFVGSGANVTINVGDVFVAVLRLRVTCGTETRTVFHNIFVGGAGSCDPSRPCVQNPNIPGGVQANFQSPTGPTAGISLWPNPSRGEKISLSVEGVVDETLTVHVVSTVNRQVVKTIPVNSSDLEDGKALLLAGLQPGLYTVKIIGQATKLQQSLIVIE